MEKEYVPKWTNKAFRRRALQAIKFCDTYLRPDKPQWLSSKYLERPEIFGSNSIGQYLKKKLLICVNERYRVSTEFSQGRCKEYILNESGLLQLRRSLGLNEQREIHPRMQAHIEEFQSGEFLTTVKAHREIHPCQNLPSITRAIEMSKMGYLYNSDIEAAAPTLLYQYALNRSGLTKRLTAIEYLLTNKSQVRQRLCDLLELNTDRERLSIKRCLTGMFMGMYISKRWDSDCSHLFDHKTILIERLQKDLFIQRLRKEIRIMWTYIRRYHNIKTRLSPKKKSDLYFQLEREVREVAKRYIRSLGIKFYPEHDGWRTNEIYDVRYLESLIKIQTGFQVRIDWEQCITNKT